MALNVMQAASEPGRRAWLVIPPVGVARTVSSSPMIDHLISNVMTSLQFRPALQSEARKKKEEQGDFPQLEARKKTTTLGFSVSMLCM